MTTLPPVIQAVPFVGVDAQSRPVRAHPDFQRWLSQPLSDRIGSVDAPSIPELSDDIVRITSQLEHVAPGAYQVRLFSDIKSILWVNLGLAVPDAIKTSGYTILGKGGATYFRLPSGDYEENEYTIKDGDGHFWQLPFDKPIEAEQLGALGDAGYTGSIRTGTDDTAALNLAMSGLWKDINVNPRAYLVSGLGLMPAPGVRIIGCAGEGYTDNVNPSNPQMLPTFIGQSGSVAVFNFGYLRNSSGLATQVRSVTLENIFIDGVDGTFPGVSAGTNHLRFVNSQIINCSSGIGEQGQAADGTHGSAYTNALKWLNSSANSCGIGIQNLIDGQVLGGSVANCQTYGIHCTTGANSNTFIGIRVEFTQAGPNLGFYQCSDIIVADLMSDRAFNSSVDIRQCSEIQLGNIKHRRPGKAGGGSDVGVYIEDSQGVTITNNHISAGHDDGGSPPNTPTIGVLVNNTSNPDFPCGDITIDGGRFNVPSPLVAFPVRDQIPSLVVVNVDGVPNYDNRSLLKQKDGRLYYAPNPDSQSTELNPGDSFSWTFSLPAINAASTDAYALTVTTRWKTTPANRNHAKFGLFAYQEAAGTANIVPTSVYGEYGTPGAIAFGTGTVANLAISAVSVSDASSFTLTVTNTDPTHVIQVLARVTTP